ncbi:MAG: sugar ABC transporter permease, partial [Lachnospiraceae bacterium]|nr:sugar ABC transporter permease [Lachnospiraceae bacterium]
MSTALTEGKSRKKSAWKNALTVLLFVLPALIPLIIFWIYPILRSVWLSFTNWDFMTPDYDVVGLKNYISLLKDSRFYNALWNTVVFTAGTLVPTIAGGLGLALLLRKNFRGSGIFKFVLFSPWITPTVAISIVWTWIFKADGGIANIVLGFFGLPALKWINSSSTAMLSVIIVTVWKSLGYAMIFYLSALEQVPAELYEASSLDGAK